jgi:large subunit ribosomal protein L3
MVKAILGEKLRQTSRFDAEGTLIPVTEVEAGPCTVMQIKTPQNDGYQAIKLGFKGKKAKKAKEAGKETPRFLREVPTDSLDYKVGDRIKVGEVFVVGDKVNVSGTSKGKGFAGVVKRWGFAGGPRTHGQSDRERAPGSIGQTTTPGRVYKGKKMAGRMGHKRVTVKGLKVVEVNPEKNLLVISGLVPGAKGSLVLISKL